MKQLTIALVSATLGVALAFYVSQSTEGPDQHAQPQEERSRRANLAELNERVAQKRPRQVVPTEEGVQRIPGQPGYDPTLLNSLFDTDSRSLYEAEPVVEEFAGPRAVFIREALRRDLANQFPDAQIQEIDCRTSSCRVEVSGPLDQDRDLYSFIQTPPFGDVQQPQMTRDANAGVVTIAMVILFNAENRDHASYEQRYRERRHQILNAMRAAGREVRAP